MMMMMMIKRYTILQIEGGGSAEQVVSNNGSTMISALSFKFEVGFGFKDYPLYFVSDLLHGLTILYINVLLKTHRSRLIKCGCSLLCEYNFII